MGHPHPESQAARAAEGPDMIAAMRQGVVEALREHKREGRSVIAWDRETQQIVEVPPEEILLADVPALIRKPAQERD